MARELMLRDIRQALPLFNDFSYDTCSLQFALQDPTLRLFADDATSPQVALLFSQSSAISFAAGNAELAPGLMDFVMNMEQDRPRLRFLSLPDEHWRQRIVSAFPNRFYEKHRISYALKHPHKTEHWLRQCPFGFHIQQIERTLAERGPQCSQWFHSYWPDADQFVAQSLGYGLIYQGRMVSVAYLVQPTSNAAEIVVETDTSFRGQGLAPVSCAALIQACVERHIQPSYSADRGHQASISVAHKVGFGHERFHCWLSGF